MRQRQVGLFGLPPACFLRSDVIAVQVSQEQHAGCPTPDGPLSKPFRVRRPPSLHGSDTFESRTASAATAPLRHRIRGCRTPLSPLTTISCLERRSVINRSRSVSFNFPAEPRVDPVPERFCLSWSDRPAEASAFRTSSTLATRPPVAPGRDPRALPSVRQMPAGV